MKKLTGLLPAFPLLLTITACTSDSNGDDDGAGTDGTDTTPTTATDTNPTDPSATDTSVDTGTDTVDPTDTDPTDPSATDTGPTGCADPNDPNATRTPLAADITADTELTCDQIWILDETIVFVRGATLTIEAGTTIQGTGGSALVIDSDASIDAQGTAGAPIVMTSVLPEGQRNRGDWGGLVLLGDAPANIGTGSAEGFENPPTYGGTDAAHNCGTLSHVRVEWAGFEISMGNELNGITFYSCGTDTSVDHVQSHMGSDDGIEMFGGNFDAKYVVVSGAADDSLDCDQGYRGKLQHVFLHQDPAVGDNCFEWSNQGTDFTATPLTGPTVANVTCIGSGAGGDKSKGMTLKEGTEAFIHSSIFANITNQGVFMANEATKTSAEGGGVVIEGTFFFEHGGFAVDADSDITWTDTDLQTFVTGGTGVVDGTDPGLPSVEWTNPNIAPDAGAAVAGAGATPGDAFFDATDYAGAVEPGGTDWTQEAWINYAI